MAEDNSNWKASVTTLDGEIRIATSSEKTPSGQNGNWHVLVLGDYVEFSSIF